GSLQDRKRKNRRAGQGRHADRQRTDRSPPHFDDRQRFRARSGHRYLRQERPGRPGRRRPTDVAHGQDHRRRHGIAIVMAQQPVNKSYLRSALEIVGIVLAVFVAKAAIAEPFYVPSGSVEPTLLIGDELLAMKYPYGYGTSSLPAFIVLPNSPHVLPGLPK